ncbi:translin-associated factor X-interacting protein 1-like [Argopecten irradians]|uniref:translin-associated factor X-interacting protein 1-like n=1 Tax=Argopecten irradians TaxID=31199 RepID=UPI003712CCC6
MEGKMAMARTLPPLAGRGGAIGPMSPRMGPKFDGLTGPSYRLDNKTYPLPNPKALKPYADTTAGAVDTWPAHASGHNVPRTTLVLTKNKSLVLYDEDLMGKPQIIPKPRFLEQLEGYLKTELKALGVTQVLPNDLRLQAHREVFEYLIEDFKTYKPLLSSIKNEYEMMLSFQRQQIRELDPLKQMLVTVSEQCDQKIMAIREEEKQEIKDLKLENKRLMEVIQMMNNEQKDLKTQVSKLQEDLAAEYHRYRDECDARKQLVSDINDLRYQQDDYMMSKQSASDEAQDDPMTLKIALKKAREDEKAATERLNNMVANYGDVIPRRDFELLEAKYNKLQELYTTAQDDFLKLQKEHDALLDVHKTVTKQRDEYYMECETLKRSSTPRPDWDKCADHVQGGMARWQELSQGKRSNELVDVLIAEIAAGGAGDLGGAEYFDGQGTGPTVPKYLQVEGPVRNRRLGKRDCSMLIRDIWREKVAHDAERTDGQREAMGDFLDLYLQRRFAMPQMKIEWGYNLQDACERYAHDDLIGLFWGVLTFNIDEEIYHDQMNKIEQLLNHLTNADMEKGNQEKISKDELRQGIRATFPGMEDEALMVAMKAAEVELDSKEEDIEYKELFKEDDEGRTGPFLEELMKFIKQERLTYVEDIKQQLAGINNVTVDDLKRALSLADPEIDNTLMDKYLAWAFDTTEDKFNEVEPLEQSKLVERLRNGCLHRAGKKM